MEDVCISRDKPNKVLAKLLADQKGSSKLPESMHSNRGELVNSVTEKVQVFVDYCEELYSSSDPVEKKIDEFLISIEIPQIAQEHKLVLEKPVAPQEIDQATLKLKPNRSPGPDGLTAEFY